MTPRTNGKALDTSHLKKAVRTHHVQLGGKVAFDKAQFTLDSAVREPIQGKPFTAAEVMALAPRSKQRSGSAGNEVLVTGKKGVTHWVAIDAYVAGLNSFESFLNANGYTLRDGAFAGKGGKVIINQDLGLRYRLLAPVKRRPFGNDKAIRNYDLFFIPEEIVDPTGNPTAKWRTRSGYQILQQPSARGYQSPFSGSVNWRATQTGNFKVAGVNGVNAPAAAIKAPVPGAPPPPPPPGGDCAEQCTLKKGDYGLSPVGQQIYDNVHLYNVWRCVITPTQGTALVSDDNPCRVGDTDVVDKSAIKTDVHALDVYGYLFTSNLSYETWKAQYDDLCKMLAAFGLANFNTLYTKVNPNAGEASSAGNETKTTGKIAGDFYDGKLDLDVVDIRDCMGQASDNGWFSASLCATYGSGNHYAKGPGFNVSDRAAVNSHVTLFGLNYVLLDGQAAVSWLQPSPGAKSPAGETPPTVVETKEDTTLNPDNTSTTYDGPSAIVPIGPVPLTITSSLTTDLRIGETKFKNSTPAYYSPIKGQDVLGVSFGAGAGVHVNVDAGIDAVVASAGVDGQLDLVQADAAGGITSTLDTGANTATVEKTYTLSGHALAGTLSAYVEIDLLLYSKRWSIELAHFDGVDLPGDETKLTYTANAIIPGTETVTCQ